MNMGREKVDLIQTPYIIHSASLTSAALQVSCFPHSRWHSSQIEPPLRRHAKLYLHGERQHCRDDRVTQHHWDLHSHTSSLWFIYRTTSSFFSLLVLVSVDTSFVCYSEWACVSVCSSIPAGVWVRSRVWGGTLTQARRAQHHCSPSSFPAHKAGGRKKKKRGVGEVYATHQSLNKHLKTTAKKNKKRREKPRWEMAHCVLPLLFTQH